MVGASPSSVGRVNPAGLCFHVLKLRTPTSRGRNGERLYASSRLSVSRSYSSFGFLFWDCCLVFILYLFLRFSRIRGRLDTFGTFCPLHVFCTKAIWRCTGRGSGGRYLGAGRRNISAGSVFRGYEGCSTYKDFPFDVRLCRDITERKLNSFPFRYAELVRTGRRIFGAQEFARTSGRRRWNISGYIFLSYRDGHAVVS